MPDSLEVALGKLQESVKNLSEREQEHHATVLAELKDIKENINPRLTTLENGVFMKVDFNQFYTGVYASKQKEQDKSLETLEKRTTKIESFNNKIIGGIILLNVIWGSILVFAVAYYSKH